MPEFAPTPKLFDALDLCLDKTPRGGPEQMACDEALLHWVKRPLLRVFHWSRPWVSAGYFTPIHEAQALRPELPVCRRWTGGGIVIHDGDFTFSLIIPRHEAWATMRSADSYCALHKTLTCVLENLGYSVSLASRRTEAGHECFASPVQHDILLAGKKVVGGAQRRTRHGLLHQGSIQTSGLNFDTETALAQAFANHVSHIKIPASVEKKAAHLTREKYARESFLHRV